MTELTVGEALVRLLEHYAVDTVFGIPGVHTLELYRGLQGSSIHHVLARHEQGAGFMADGYARATGKPGICFLISGPGVGNASTAIGQAYADSIPLLIISSVNTVASLGQGWGCLHECQNQNQLTSAITAFSATAYTADSVPDLLARAFAVFESQRPRPVHLSIPLDVLAAPAGASWPQKRPRPIPHSVASEAALAEARTLLTHARRPVVIAGGGAVHAAQALQQLAERLQAPVFTSVAGKGVLPPGHGLHAGATMCQPQGWQALEQADAVVVVGSEMAETDFWKERLELCPALVRIDLDPRKFHDRYPCAVALCGDAKQTLEKLLEGLAAREKSGTELDCQALQERVRSGLAPLQQTHWRILQALQAVLPERTRVAADMTQLGYSANYLLPVSGPRRWLHPTGYGTLGYALPAGIGAQIAIPEDPVLVIVGDGGLLYTLSELATAREAVQGSLVVLLWNNQALGQIRDDMLERGIRPIGVLPMPPDFAMLAKAFGCHFDRPVSLSACQQAVRDGFARTGVSVIELTEAAAQL
jgi:5-guanidino-2-oxopentanoate decarboxylase